MINFITFTGIDERTNLTECLKIKEQAEEKNIFIEYGVLISLKRQGQENSYPSRDKRMEFLNSSLRSNLSGHLCGSKIMKAFANKDEELLNELKQYPRIQINIFASDEKQREYILGVIETAKELIDRGIEIIFPYNNGNKYLYEQGIIPASFNILVDFSGGTGATLSKEHVQDKSILSNYNKVGLAGGLSSDNLEEKLIELKNTIENNNHITWIDGQSSFRDDKDNFDLKSCRKFFEIFVSTLAN